MALPKYYGLINLYIHPTTKQEFELEGLTLPGYVDVVLGRRPAQPADGELLARTGSFTERASYPCLPFTNVLNHCAYNVERDLVLHDFRFSLS